MPGKKKKNYIYIYTGYIHIFIFTARNDETDIFLEGLRVAGAGRGREDGVERTVETRRGSKHALNFLTSIAHRRHTCTGHTRTHEHQKHIS